MVQQLFNNTFHSEYQNNYSHNPNVALKGQGTTHLEQVTYMMNDVNMLTVVMTDQALIQASVSLVETFDGNKNKYQAWITSVENAAQISSQHIMQIAC